MAGKEFIVDGAPCMCKYGAAPGKLKVTNQQFFNINGNKLGSTTLAVGNVFYPPGFGMCKVNPMMPKPCMPSVTEWKGQFDKISVMGGYLLTDKSKGTCGSGSPDCIEFMQTGQIAVPGMKQMQQATAEHQGELDAMGVPSALTDHPVNTRVSIQAAQTQVLVKKVKGPDEAFPGQTLTYEVEHYNIKIIDDKIRSSVKWKVIIDGKEEAVKQPGNDILELRVKTEWQGKELRVTAYIKEPSVKIDKKTNVKKWTFPIVIDRYKMPGLNPAGTDIADDMAYGYGEDVKKQVYSASFVQSLKEGYQQAYENKTLDPNLSNSTDYDPAPPLLPVSQGDVQENIKKKIRIKNGKAKYRKEDMSTVSSVLQGMDRFNRKLFSDFTDAELFADFEQMAKNVFSSFNSAMRGNIQRMIKKFRENKGGIYEDAVLTDYVRKHPSTLRYCNELEKYIKNKLQLYKGDISGLEDISIDFNIYHDPVKAKEKRKESKQKDFSLTPVYGAGFSNKEELKNTFTGITIATNDIWATEVIVKKYTLNNKSYEMIYQVTLWDHFGLDAPDLAANKTAAYGSGFRAWFILQHLRGYKPFITKITFERNLKGNL